MVSINERIRLILDREKIANKEVAEWFGITNSRISQKFKDGIWDSMDELLTIAARTGYRVDWIVNGEEPMKLGYNILQEPVVSYGDRQTLLQELADCRKKLVACMEENAELQKTKLNI